MEQALYFPIALGAAGVAVYTDTRFGLISNRLTVGTFLLGVGLHAAFGGWEALGAAVLGGAVGLGLLLVPYLLGGMGAGDAKLMAALGTLAGVQTVFAIFGWACMLGGLIALVVLIRTHGIWGIVTAVLGGWKSLLSPDMRVTRLTGFPFASSILFGVVASAALGAWG